MDHRETPAFASRLFYLTDRAAAERNDRLFLVLATRGFPEDWLLQKLEHDGARIRLIQDLKTGYRDGQLYKIAWDDSLLSDDTQ